MKKINAAIVLTVLLAVHALVLFAFFGKPKLGEPAHPGTPSAPRDFVYANRTGNPLGFEPTTSRTFVPPHDAISDRQSHDAPPRRVRETIAVPGRRPGRLRTDRPPRTAKNLSKRTRSPYVGAIVVDAATARILFEDHPTDFAYPASVTKLMTFHLVLQAVETGRIRLSDKVRVTPEVAKIGGSQIYLDPHETNFTVEDLLYAVMVHSANDAARALALHLAGSEKAFVAMMNAEAQRLGMHSTRYQSDCGLPPSGNALPDVSTPYDVALLALAVLRHPTATKYAGTELRWLNRTYGKQKRIMLSNRNALVKHAGGYPGCDGLKTGYHARGGWSIVATARRGDRRVVAVVLGSPDKKSRYAAARKLLDKGFDAEKTTGK